MCIRNVLLYYPNEHIHFLQNERDNMISIRKGENTEMSG